MAHSTATTSAASRRAAWSGHPPGPRAGRAPGYRGRRARRPARRRTRASGHCGLRPTRPGSHRVADRVSGTTGGCVNRFHAVHRNAIVEGAVGAGRARGGTRRAPCRRASRPAARRRGHLLVDDGAFADGRADDGPAVGAKGIQQAVELGAGQEIVRWRVTGVTVMTQGLRRRRPVRAGASRRGGSRPLRAVGGSRTTASLIGRDGATGAPPARRAGRSRRSRATIDAVEIPSSTADQPKTSPGSRVMSVTSSGPIRSRTASRPSTISPRSSVGRSSRIR